MIQEMIDWEDNRGIIGFDEWEKRKESRKNTEKYLDEIDELSVNEWIILILFLNNNKMQKTQLFKELFLMGERLGLNEFPLFNWIPYRYGPYSRIIEDKLDELKEKKIIEINLKDTSKFCILKQNQEIEKTWETFPEPIKKIIVDIVQEFGNKTVKEIKDYIYAAYPKYAVNVK